MNVGHEECSEIYFKKRKPKKEKLKIAARKCARWESARPVTLTN
jgi:hypothetical protein